MRFASEVAFACRRSPLRIYLLDAVAAVIVLAIALNFSGSARADSKQALGAYGPEGPRLREQLWILPSGDKNTVLRATVFRPQDVQSEEVAGTTRRPLVIINHGTSDDTRLAVSMPVYYWLSRWFVERGYVVVLPQRRGHGATGGDLAESIGSCANPNHLQSGRVAADDIEAVIEFMQQQSFVQSNETVVVGISTGGWASLALAARNPAPVRGIINFAGGRGAHAIGQPTGICGEEGLVSAARAFGETARVPTIWFYADNDSYFGPTLATEMAQAWEEAGGHADLHILPAYGSDGHEIADDRAGWNIWGPAIDKFLGEIVGPTGPPLSTVAHGAPEVASPAAALSDEQDLSQGF